MSVTRHSERRVVAYAPMQLFELVADVPRYPEFLPWCHAGRIRRREGPDVQIAELAAHARAKGFLTVSASPLTRSSYHAGDDFARLRAARAAQLKT